MREIRQSVKNFGIIVKVARLHWNKWPPHIRAVYELDDLIQDIIAMLMSKLHMYDASRAQASTFVWTLTANHCKTLLNSYMSQKRQHYPVELKEANRCGSQATEILWREARGGFEALLGDASDDLRDALDQFIDQRDPNPRKMFGPALIQELQGLTTRHRVNRDALALLLNRV